MRPKASMDLRFDAKWRIGPGGCHLWTASTDKRGYGKIGKPGKSGGWMFAHRYAYERKHGAIPDGKVVRHQCDNPRCVNPDHLTIGTAKDNVRDMWKRGRAAHGERMSVTNLTNEDVRQIRERVAAGELQYKVAAEYGVHKVTISQIIRRLRWKHIH